MKSEPKPFASLSSGLLARKGAAKPAMRPQGFGQGAASLEDLGWNDMGFEPPRAATAVRDERHDAFGVAHGEQPPRNPLATLTAALPPLLSPVHHQQAEIAGRMVSGSDEVEDVLELEAEAAVEAEFRAAAEADAEAEAEAEPEAFAYAYADADDDELDETAELYVPEPVAPVVIVAPEAPPEVAPVVRVKAERSSRKAAGSPVAAGGKSPDSRPAASGKAKAAFTLRLEPSRHLKLRLACAVSGRSAQLLVTDALDRLLSSMPELDAMAASANRKG